MKGLTIGKRIQLLRKQKKMSVVEFSRRIGKSRATIYRYENDEIEEMPYTILIPIAKALDTTPTYLLGYDSEDVPKEESKNTKLIDIIEQIDLSDTESDEIVNYINFIISKRK